VASHEFKFWLWKSHGLIRQKCNDASWHDLEVWENGQWAIGSPYAMDAVTGMGPDPWSCGEYAEELSLEQAEAFAAANQVDLFGPGPTSSNR